MIHHRKLYIVTKSQVKGILEEENVIDKPVAVSVTKISFSFVSLQEQRVYSGKYNSRKLFKKRLNTTKPV